MALQSGKDPMITHPLSSVYGMYVIEFDGEAQFCTADPEILFQNLEGIEFKDCDKVRVILLSSEDWSRDDITDLVWEAMAEHYADGPGVALPETVEEWDEIYGYDIGFIRWGIENEFDATAERARRQAAFEARLARFSKFRQPETALAIAAE